MVGKNYVFATSSIYLLLRVETLCGCYTPKNKDLMVVVLDRKWKSMKSGKSRKSRRSRSMNMTTSELVFVCVLGGRHVNGRKWNEVIE